MKIIASDLAINYESKGTGPAIVMLHGWGVQAGNLTPLALELAKNYRVVWLDLPGHGGSEAPPTTWGATDYAQFIVQFLDKLGIGRVEALIGHSFGGRIAIRAVGDGLIMPHKLILLDSAGIDMTQSFRNRGFKTIALLGKALTNTPVFSALRQPLRRRLYKAAGSTDYLRVATHMRETFVKTIREDQLDAARKIKLPTLLIWGSNDDITPLKQEGKLLHEAIAGSRLEVIAGAKHFVHLDALSQVTKLVMEFLEKSNKGRAS